MPKNEILFKAATFLTAILKSDIKDTYLRYGFTREDMLREIESIAAKTTSGFFDDYKDKIEDNINDVLSCLSFEGLVYYKNDRYYITEDGEGISHFMVSLSKMYFKETQAMMNFPYRFYPNSEQIYGLN